jgi:hypothetical protein
MPQADALSSQQALLSPLALAELQRLRAREQQLLVEAEAAKREAEEARVQRSTREKPTEAPLRDEV